MVACCRTATAGWETRNRFIGEPRRADSWHSHRSPTPYWIYCESIGLIFSQENCPKEVYNCRYIHHSKVNHYFAKSCLCWLELLLDIQCYRGKDPLHLEHQFLVASGPEPERHNWNSRWRDFIKPVFRKFHSVNHSQWKQCQERIGKFHSLSFARIRMGHRFCATRREERDSL